MGNWIAEGLNMETDCSSAPRTAGERLAHTMGSFGMDRLGMALKARRKGSLPARFSEDEVSGVCYSGATDKSLCAGNPRVQIGMAAVVPPPAVLCQDWVPW